ncbi:MAG: thiamine diphosphokinase [Elusimicrobiota bacterium]|nr:MAG: thiamine diphosphokinase [Elusimicrobiota bacterium]
MIRTALILLNGELRGPREVRAAARASDAVICADGGARHAARLGVEPDYVVGDMDSAPRRPRAWRKAAYVVDSGTERSDLDKALAFARGLGVREAFVAGVLGGGLDHELVNLAALEEGARGLALTVIDGGRARLLGPGRHRLLYKRGARFSLLAAPRARLTLTGARFALRDEPLARGSRGLGNSAAGRVVLTVSSGRVWAIDAGGFRG